MTHEQKNEWAYEFLKGRRGLKDFEWLGQYITSTHLSRAVSTQGHSPSRRKSHMSISRSPQNPPRFRPNVWLRQRREIHHLSNLCV